MSEELTQKYHRFIHSSDSVNDTNVFYFQIPLCEFVKENKIFGDYKLDFKYYDHIIRLWIQIQSFFNFDYIRITSLLRLLDKEYPKETHISVLIANDEEMIGYSYDKTLHPYTRKYKLSSSEFKHKKVIMSIDRQVKLQDFLYVGFHMDINPEF